MFRADRRTPTAELSRRTDPLETRVMLAADMWQPLGPFSATNGQVENISNGDRVVGAAHTVLAHPTDADVLWLGATNGGVWRTDNATDTNPNWTPLTDDLPSLSIGAMTFDAADPTSNTVLVGVGRFSSFGRTGGDRVGVYKTTDGGATWTVLDGGGVLRGKNISGIHANGNTIVVSVNTADQFNLGNTGIFRSTDGGATFQQISQGNGVVSGLPGGVSYDLVADPLNPATLYTSMVFADIAGGTNGVFKSTDTGETWTRVSTPEIEAFMSNNTSNLEMAVGRHDNVYFSIINNGRPDAFFRSGDGGATWTQLDTPSTNENGTDVGLNPRGQKGPGPGAAPEEIAGGQGSIHFSIVADPTDPNIVYVGGDRQPRTDGDTGGFPNSIGANDFTGRLFRGDASQAAGSQWAHITHRNDLGAAGGGTASNSSPHADSREMVFDANGDIIEVDDGGIYRRTQPRSDQGDWFALTGDLQTTEAHDVAWDSVSNTAITGNQDTGTTYQTSEGVPLWDSLSTADGGDVTVDDVSLAAAGFSIRYTSFQNLGGFRRTTWDANGNLVGQAFPNLTVTSGAPFSPAFVTPVVLNAVNPQRLAIQGSNSVYESLNQGNTIAEVGNGVGVGFGSSGVAYGGIKDGLPNEDVLWATSGQNVFFRSAAGQLGNATGNLFAGTLRDLVIDANDWASAFTIDSDQIFATFDEGGFWQDITGSLAGVVDDFRSLAFVAGPAVDAILLGTGSGLFATSLTTLGTWERVGTGLPNALVYDLEYDATDDVLVAGTLGRGAWKLDDVIGTLQRANVGQNDPPVIENVPPRQTVELGPQFTPVAPNATVTDPTSRIFAGALFRAVTFRSSFQPGDDVIVANGNDVFISSLEPGADVTVDGVKIGEVEEFFSGHLDIRLSASATPERVQKLTRQVHYRALADGPTRTVRILIEESDGERGLADTKIDVTAQSVEAPEIGFPSTQRVVAPNVGFVPLTADATLEDDDSTEYPGGLFRAIELAGSVLPGDEVRIRSGNGVSVSAQAVGGSVRVDGVLIGLISFRDDRRVDVRLNQNASRARVLRLLRSVHMRVTQAGPDRDVRIILEEADGLRGQIDLLVSNVDNPPTITGVPASQSVPAGSGFQPIAANADVADVDAFQLDGGLLRAIVFSSTAQPGDELRFRSSGDVSVSSQSVGGFVRVGGVLVGEIIARDNRRTDIRLNANATPSRVRRILRVVSFQSTQSSPTRTVRLLLEQSNGLRGQADIQLDTAVPDVSAPAATSLGSRSLLPNVASDFSAVAAALPTKLAPVQAATKSDTSNVEEIVRRDSRDDERQRALLDDLIASTTFAL